MGKIQLEEYPNTWKTLSSDTIYSNDWISVREDKVKNPSGGDGIYGVVEFKNLAIGIIPIDEEENTWLVGQYRYPLNEYSWEIPMGGGSFGIAPLTSAQRELKEETGIEASKWTLISKIHTSNCVTNEVGYIYTAEGLSFGETKFEETEDLKIKKIHLSDALQLVMESRITDAISIAGILKVARMRTI